jgi:hypothetical protein
MALSSEDAAWLAELKAYRKKLIKGEAVASLSSGGRSVSYSNTNATLAQVDAEIARLEALDGQTDTRRGAITFAIKS